MKKRIVFVLLALCLVLGLCLGLAACKKDEPATAAQQEVELYWNVEAKEYLAGTYTRTAQEDGTVMMIFSKDGEQMRLPVKDYYLACKLDLWGVAGLVFDENGVVVDALRVEECTGGYIANKCIVTKVEGTTVTCNTSGLLDGRDIVFELPEGTPIWNVAGTGITVGIPWTVGVDDQVIVIANEDGSVKCVYTEGYVEPMDVYWNVNRMYDSTTKKTTRMSEAGGYSFLLACNGEQVTLRSRDSKVAQDIDAQAAKCFGLKFDEEGYITEVIHGGSATGGGSAASWYDCIEVDGQRAEFERKISGNLGATYSGTMAKNVKVFDVSGNGAFVGEPTELRVGDRVHCLLDSRNRLSVIFVVNRRAESPVYWNVDRMWSSAAAKTTRTPNDNGVYEILVAVGGQQKTVYTTDWEIANKIDGRAAMCFGLRLDEHDNIEKFYTPESVTGGTYASWYNITKLDGDNIELTKSSNGDVKNGKIAANCEIYDCSPSAQYEGIKTTLQEGDLVHTLKNDNGEICVAFVITRYVQWPVYYNLDRKYDSVNQMTTRPLTADGYYEYRMAVDGQEVMLRTKSFAVANAIDKEVAKCLTMSVCDDGLITKAMHAKNSTLASGAARSSYTTVTAVREGGFTTYKSDTKKYTKETYAWNCKVYNVSTNVLSHQGEETTVQVGDYVHCLSNLRKEITFVFIMSRPLNLPVYYNLDRMWSDSTGASTRTPNADGEYEFKLAYGGGEVTLKTTDPQVVYDIDKEVAKCVALRVNDEGYITKAVHAKNSTYCGGGIGMSYATVTEVNGKKVTVLKDGVYTTFEISDDCEMFVTKDVEGLKRGNYTTVREGDFIHCLKDKSGKTNYMAIMSRVKQMNKVEHTCDHGDGDTWYEWDGTAFPKSGNYVLTGDIEMTERVTISAGVEITLCLNGHKVTNPDRFFSLYGTLNICDHKNASGKYEGVLETGFNGSVYGGLAYMYNDKGNSELNIYGGNIVHTGVATTGGLVFIGQNKTSGYTATMNLYDGVLTGGNATKGGAVAVSNACTFNMYGGEISGNNSKTIGGGVYVADGTFNMYGGTITNNTSVDSGAGVATDSAAATFNMFGGYITSNTATGNGGGININNGEGYLFGGNVKNNKAAEGGSARVGQNGMLSVSGDAVVTGGSAKNGGNFTVIGKLYITGATISGGTATGLGTEISAYSNAATANAKVYLEDATVNGTIRLGAGQGKTEMYVLNSTVTGKITVQTNNNNIEVAGKVSLNEVNLADGKVITIGDSGLDDTSSIKVSMVNTELPFTTVTDTNDIAVFKPASSTEKVVVSGNDLYLQSTVAVHKHCACGGLGKVGTHTGCSNVTYAAWTSSDSLPTSGNYYLTCDVKLSGPVTLTKSVTTNLCLNGFNITSDTRVFSIYGTFNLCDCAESQGVITGNTTGTQANGGVFYVYTNTTFNFFGGTMTAAKKVTGEGGIGCVAGSATGVMNVYGGVIDSGKATKNGGNIIIWDGANLYVYGGIIQNGSSTGGGNVGITKGNLIIAGGKLIGGTSSGYGGNVRAGQDGTLTMTGGAIQGGYATTGGGCIYGNKSGTNVPEIKLLGGKISGGSAGGTTAGYQCVLSFGEVIVGGSVQIEDIYVNNHLVNSTEKPLTESASIGVSGTVKGVFIEGITQEIAEKFTCNASSSSLYYDSENQTLELV